MSDRPPQSQPRGRTASRLRFVAPPGISVARGEAQTIGRYEVQKTLGKGAMGVVYKARDPLLDRIVAVKTIGSPKGVGKRVRAAYLERFEREAKAAAKMQHPAIVTIFDVGLDEGAPFMVLEYLPGETLADRLDRVRMPLGKAVPIALDLASALGFAHKHRIVHRDMKPANVLHAGEGRWKLADFGIARLPDSDLTQIGIFMGTPGYSPPEAIREGRYTLQADIFAWGAVLYELLCGYIPYEGPDTQTTNRYVMKGAAPSPRHYDPSIPEPLADVTMRALSADTNLRYKDGIEAEKALKKAWDYCLKKGLILPQSLAADEMPHERVGATMHGAEDGLSDDSNDDEEFLGAATGKRDALLIESSGRPREEDDDPTTIMIRDGDTAIEDMVMLGRNDEDPTVLGKRKNAGVAGASDEGSEARFNTAINTDSHGAHGGYANSVGTAEFREVAPSRTKVWIALFLVALALGAVVAFYLTK